MCRVSALVVDFQRGAHEHRAGMSSRRETRVVRAFHPGRALLLLALTAAIGPAASTARSAQAPASPAPAPEQVPTFRVESELVVIDLVPTDRQGRFVGDLRPEELRVTEEGESRPIEFLRLVRAGRATPVPPDTTPTTAATAAPSGVPAGGGDARLAALAIVIDLQGTPQEAMGRVKDAIRSTVGTEIPDGTPLLLATVWHGLAVHEPLTTDRSRFLAALDKITSPARTGSVLQQLADDIDRGGMRVEEAVRLGRVVVGELSRELADVSQSLEALSRWLAPIPGRKHVTLYSAGHAIRPAQALIALLQSRFSSAGQYAARELAGFETNEGVAHVRRVVDEANRAQVSFYTIDPMGLQSDLLDATTGGSVAGAARTPAGIGLRRKNVRELQDYLRAIGRDTGGRTFINTNDVAMGLRRAWAEAREYYVVGFVPSEAEKPGFRRVEVKVARKGLDVQYRRGYWRESAQERSDRDIVLATRFPMLFADGDLVVEVQQTATELTVASLLHRPALVFEEREGRQHNIVSVQAFLRDAEGKLVAGKGLFQMDVDMHLSPGEFEAMQARDVVEMPATVPLPPGGTYDLLVVARHSRSRITTAGQRIVVP